LRAVLCKAYGPPESLVIEDVPSPFVASEKASPVPQFNVIFETPEFQNIVPWLMLNRDGLDVLVHPLTESNYDDHTTYALWLGTPVPLRLERLSGKLPETLLPTAQRA